MDHAHSSTRLDSTDSTKKVESGKWKVESKSTHCKMHTSLVLRSGRSAWKGACRHRCRSRIRVPSSADTPLCPGPRRSQHTSAALTINENFDRGTFPPYAHDPRLLTTLRNADVRRGERKRSLRPIPSQIPGATELCCACASTWMLRAYPDPECRTPNAGSRTINRCGL